MENTISEVTRRAIIDHLTSPDTMWSGRLSEDVFLGRIYDLAIIPSTDGRFTDAAGDIYQHRIEWQDWEDDWVFHDARFDLLNSSDIDFLRFLCETVHPVVRPDQQQVCELVSIFNRELNADGWQLVEARQISGRPTFTPQKTGGSVEIFNEPTGWPKVDRQFAEMRVRLNSASSEEQYQAVGLICREVIISVAQATFDPSRHLPLDGVTPSDTDANRMLEGVIAVELSGSVNEEARAHAKSALRLALALQHRRTADFRTAALCVEATASVVRLLAILFGRFDRQSL